LENKLFEIKDQEVFDRRIDKEYINSLPILRFKGKILLIDSKDKLKEVCKKLFTEEKIGFDTESRPAFKKGTYYPISIVQLSTLDTAYIIQLKKTGFSDELIEIFENENILKVGIGLKDDIRKLKKIRDFNEASFIDLSKIAESKGIIQSGMRALSARYLGYRISKTSRQSNWALDELTPKQLNYAATDAWVSLILYDHVVNDSHNYKEETDDS
jgi:ribonuclease D